VVAQTQQRQSTLKLAIGGKFSFLLVSLLLFLIVHPFLEAKGPVPVTGIFLSAVMVAGIYSVVNDRRFLIVALVLAAPALISRWLLHFSPVPWLVIADFVFDILFFSFNTYAILSYILRKRAVTADMIYGAACAYLLLGVVWGLIFGLLEFVQPGSFAITGTVDMEAQDLVVTMLYYSFVTLTTLGYGDLVPVTPPARSLSFLEAVLGQLYLAILIARLVGMHISWKE
jgi:hypothetical protein